MNRFQSAPRSLSKRTIVVAWRDRGGYWSSTTVDVGKPWSLDDLLHAAVTAEYHDDYYYNHDGKNITEKEAKGILSAR